MDEQTKIFRIAEDKYKSASIKFEKNIMQQEISGKDVIVFEERCLQDGGDWVYFIRYPNIPEEEILKLRKAKPKTLPNPNELFF